MEFIPQTGYYSGGYSYNPNEYGNNVLLRGPMVGPSGYMWSSSVPPPAPALMLPQKPAVGSQLVPVATRSAVYDDYPVTSEQITVTRTSRLTKDGLRQVTDDLSGNQGSDGDIVIIPAKPVKWRIVRQQKVPPTKKTPPKALVSNAIPANVTASASYVSPPGNAYLAPAVQPLYQPSSAHGGYYVPVSTGLDVAYQPITGYYM
jgi:hypothetical protein